MTPAEKRKAIGLGGLALVGLGIGLYFEQQQPAPKPAPPPAPTPTPTPTPAPAPGRTQTVCGCLPNDAGICSTWCSTLWGIAEHWYGNGALYPRIHAANAELIEATAQAHGFATSGGGHWIFPGMVLTIP